MNAAQANNVDTAPGQERAETSATCVHCATPFRPTVHRKDFCCAGCEFVHRLIRERGLGKFYDLRSGPSVPIRSLVFQSRDYSWLSDLVKAAETGHAPPNLTLDLQGLSCIGCVWLIETLFHQLPGALCIEINSTLGTLSIRWKPGEFDALAFARELQSFGYLVGPPGKNSPPESRSLGVRIGICGALALNTMIFTLPAYLGMEQTFEFAPLFNRLSLILATLSLAVGGSYFFGRTIRSLRRRVLHIDLPISLGLIAAWLGSVYAWAVGEPGFLYFDFVAIFVLLMLAGRWLQQRAIERNRNYLLKLSAEPAPVTGEAGDPLPVPDLTAGDRYTLKPGQPVPVRSRLLSRAATLGLEWINGESEAHAARQGRVIPSGAIHLGRDPIQLEAAEAWENSILASLVRNVPTSGYRNRSLERFLRSYIAVILAIAASGFATWFLTTGHFLPALQVLISVLVVSCPCAAGVAIPMADELATTGLRRHGVFVREPGLWGRLGSVRKILFDKTGTLTLETMELQNPEALESLDAGERSVLLEMVHDNMHPVSCALREELLCRTGDSNTGAAAREIGLPPHPIDEIVGEGLEWGSWRLGRPKWALANPNGSTAECIFSRDGRPLAALQFSESVRRDAREEIDRLKNNGHTIHILSGDRREKVARMARQLGIPAENATGEMSPGEKAEVVRQLDHRDTLMIGDGANDSLAFNVAHCTGTPAIDRGLLEQKADFYFLGRSLFGIRCLLQTARRRVTAVHRVLAFAVLYNLVTVAISLAGHMNPLAASILMPLSSVVSLAIVLMTVRTTDTGEVSRQWETRA